MILKENDFRIEEDGIWISKKALEEVRDYYRELCKEHAKFFVDLGWSEGVDLGKRDILNEILKHFENKKVTEQVTEVKIYSVSCWKVDDRGRRFAKVIHKHLSTREKANKYKEDFESKWQENLDKKITSFPCWMEYDKEIIIDEIIVE